MTQYVIVYHLVLKMYENTPVFFPHENGRIREGSGVFIGRPRFYKSRGHQRCPSNFRRFLLFLEILHHLFFGTAIQVSAVERLVHAAAT